MITKMNSGWLDGISSALAGAINGDDNTCRLFEATDEDKTLICDHCGLRNVGMSLLMPKPGEISLFQACNECMIKVTRGSNMRMEIHAYKQCLGCNGTDKPVKVCGRCRNAYYCQPSCQKADWSRHKKECKA